MNILEYYSFYHRLTKGRLPVLFAINIVAVLSQMCAAGALLTVVQYGNPEANRITKIVYELLSFVNIREQNWQIAVLLLFATIAFSISSISLMASTMFTARLQSSIYVDIQPATVKKLVLSDYEYFQTQNTGTITNVMVQQIRVVAQSFKLYADIILNSLFAIIYLVGSLSLEPVLCTAMLVLGIPFIWGIRTVNKKSQEISVMNVNEVSRMNGIIIQIVSNLKYLKSTGAYEKVLPRLKDSAKKLASYVVRIAFWSGLSSYGVTPFAIAFISILIFWQIVYMKAPIITALTALGFLYAAAQKVIAIPSSYQKFLVSAGSIIIFEDFIRELNSNLEVSLHGKGQIPNFNGSIIFENVSFKYKHGKDEVLKNFNISIDPNSSVAFVGGSGAGKSTVVNLVTGLLKPTSGKISISGADYSGLDMDELRKKIGYVTQESVIFNDSVNKNISLWDFSADKNKIQNFAKRAHADNFIKEMPDSYDTLLGENGINISGGQRQRISIARELYRQTPLLILDEATSSLDSETERIIHDSIDEFKGQKTLLIIAHRLSTIRNCDHIYVLEKGYVVESGSYDELCAKDGKFKEMVDRQTLLSPDK